MPTTPLGHIVTSSSQVAGEVEPLVVGQTAPDAVRLAGDDRCGEALDANLTHQADRLGLWCALAGLGVEQLGVRFGAEREDFLPRSAWPEEGVVEVARDGCRDSEPGPGARGRAGT